MNYPRIAGHRRKPNPKKDGFKNYGKPCLMCGTNTIGEKWLEVSWFRGEDETIRLCSACWNIAPTLILDKLRVETDEG